MMLGLGDMVDDIAQAIGTQEGFYNGTSQVAIQNNNPGNLRSWGSNPIVSGYAQFPSLADGFAALDRQIVLNINRGLTLYEFFGGGKGYYGYAPSADGNSPRHYAEVVGAAVGIDPNVPLNQVISTSVMQGTGIPGGSGIGVPITFDPNGGISVDDGTTDAGIFGMSTTTAMIAAAAGLLLIVAVSR